MSVRESKNWFACLSFCRSCWRTPRAACTEARASTVALKLSRKAAASRYSRLASASNSRISATRMVRTRRVSRRAMPRSSDLGIGHDSQRGVEVDGIIVFRFHLQVVDTHVIGSLFDRHQQRQKLRQRYPVKSKIDRSLLIALDHHRGLWLHSDNAIADLGRRGRFFHEGQQRKLGRRDWHPLFEFSDTSLLDHVLLCDERQLLAVFHLSARLSIEFVDRLYEGINHQEKDKCCYDDGSSDGHDHTLALRELLPAFFQHLHHGRCTV